MKENFASNEKINWTILNLGVHIEVLVNGLSTVQKRVSVVGDAAVHNAVKIQEGTHLLSFARSSHPRHTEAVQHLTALERHPRWEKRQGDTRTPEMGEKTGGQNNVVAYVVI